MDLLVVGSGTMGRWIGRATGDLFEEVAVTDRDREAARAAAAALDGRVADGDESFAAVCLAVPMPAVESAAATHAPRAERAVFDVIGAMEPAVAALMEHAPGCERVSLHPLFAPDNEPGNVACVADAPGPVTDEVRAALAERGNRVFETTPDEHDEAMTTVQARAHAAVLAYALASENVREEFHTPVSAALADIATRVAGGEPHVYADIQQAFDGTDAVAEAARRIAAADPAEFERLHGRARDRLGATDRTGANRNREEENANENHDESEGRSDRTDTVDGGDDG